MAEDSQLLQLVTSALTKAGWSFARVDNPDQEVLRMDFDAHHTRVPITIQIFGPIGAVAVVAEDNHNTPPEVREKLAELLMRTNLQLTIGAFEMNWDNLRTYFRITNVFNTAAGMDQALPGMVSAAVAELDRMTPQIAELIKAKDTIDQFDIGRLMRREDYLPDPENTSPSGLELE
ncbi:YbjN domain-containing protein [Sulfuriroseicoccus oceanibius]|uniref:YbjN domain-containing protein n=1 Tax=Sulfuriroseicoccus oceanibius TaxID=2707525 RepID=A0A6B3LA97_9BACT|nr:YbjN domain-containing protein [Sulfuriroseicoccus oceanibius]QQL45299.1 YbjN domain-containing protein [Sulfuriroseicoccus oceanibius]